VTAPAVPTYAGVIGGTGEVQQSAAAAETLALTGNNTYTGGTRIAGGTLLVSSDANLGAASGKVTFFAAAGPVLKFGGAFNSARAVVLESGTGTIDANGFNVGLTGPITGPGALAVRAGAGSLAVNNVRIGGGLTVSTGKLRVATNGTPAGLSVASALSIASGATLDLANNDMIVDYSGATSPLAGIVASFRAAYHDGAWDAAGLTSSAAANAANNFLTTLGIVDNTARAITALDGVTVDNTAVLIKYVYYGDTNLDGKVDGVDVGAFSAGLAGNGALAGWQNGDFNYDGSINGDDYMLLTRAIAGQGAPLNPAVPEPTGAAAGAIAAAGMLLRRGRRRT
jgi:fibronectin-binding autotransporter adhesin